MPDERVLAIVRELNASVEAVFRAWTEPEQLCRWFHGTKTRVDSAEVDLRSGGAFRIVVNDGESVNVVYGAYVRVEPPHLLEFTWQWETNAIEPGETLVRVELEAKGGGTLLRLSHTRFSREGSYEAHGAGWDVVLASLAEYVVSGQ